MLRRHFHDLMLVHRSAGLVFNRKKNEVDRLSQASAVVKHVMCKTINTCNTMSLAACCIKIAGRLRFTTLTPPKALSLSYELRLRNPRGRACKS